MTLSAAVVGCGFIGAAPASLLGGVQSHAAAWSAHGDVRLAALVDPDPDRLGEAGARWEVADRYADVSSMLDRIRPDIVSVATPDETHEAVLHAVLEAPSVRAVLAEKPLALDARTAERLAALAAERGIVLTVNYARRFAPSHRHLAGWLAEGHLGRIEVVRGSYVRGLKHNGTHWLDLVRWLVGEIDTIEGAGTVPEGAADATIDATMTFSGGARGLLHGLAGSDYSLFELDILGSDGRVLVTEAGARIETFAVGPSARFAGFRELVPAAGPEGGLTDLLLHAATDVVDTLATGRLPAASAIDAVVALRLAERALITAQTKEEIGATADR